LGYLRTFGCHVTALPPRSRRPSKLEHEVRKGVFLGFSRTGKNAIYYDTTSNETKTTADIAYNEAEIGLGELSPNAQALRDVGAVPGADEKPT